MSVSDARTEQYTHADVPGVTTKRVQRPTPTEPAPVFEMERVFPTSNRIALFSGGDDSLVTTHYGMERDMADIVVYLDTNSGLAQNLDFVRRVCAAYHWPLVIVPSPMPLETFVMRYRWPGSTEDGHGWAYRYFKGRQLRFLHGVTDHDLILLSGARKKESGRRRVNISDEVQREESTHGDFSGWWVSPLWQKSDDWVEAYRQEHGLPHNPVKDAIHRSGDCFCMAFGHRNEVLVDLVTNYPRHYHWLMNVERRTQEYWGRLDLLAADDPGTYDAINETREEQGTPYPLRMVVARDFYPDTYRWMVDLPRSQVLQAASQRPQNWMGHGRMSSEELRSLMAEHDQYQAKLCEGCAPATNGTVDREPDPATPGAATQLSDF